MEEETQKKESCKDDQITMTRRRFIDNVFGVEGIIGFLSCSLGIIVGYNLNKEDTNLHLYKQVDEKASGIINDLLTHPDIDQEYLDIRGLKVVGSSNPDYYKSYDYVGIAHRLEDIAKKERNEGHDE